MIDEINRKIVVALTGDSMISRLVPKTEDAWGIKQIIEQADIRFTNCESLFHDYESFPLPRDNSNATMMYARRDLVKELKFFGFNMVSLCNNHTMDYGQLGLNSTEQTLRDFEITFAGCGRDLYEAREPRYLETDKGRVALLASCWAQFQGAWERAANMRSGIPARPGINLLKVESEYMVDTETFKHIKKVVSYFGKNPSEGNMESPNGDSLSLFHRKFRVGDKPKIVRKINKEDYNDLMLNVKDAKVNSDWVIVSFHVHDYDTKGPQFPADFVRQYAHSCIDAGADVFVGHGPHMIQGIEIYKDKPIFYSLGNFIVHDLTVSKVTFDQYESFNLGPQAKPSDFYKARYGIIPPSDPFKYKNWFQSIIPVLEIDGENLLGIKIIPIVMEEENQRPIHQGNPKIAKGSRSKEIIEFLSDISADWGTKITYEDEIGKISL